MRSDSRADLSAVWAAFKATGDQSARENLILAYSPLVKYVAGRLSSNLPQSVDSADLISYGVFGLIDAIEKFDPGRGFKFKTYAMTRIRGAIFDELRSIDWIPRSIPQKAKQVELVITELENSIADRREYYNESVNLNNVRIEQFPDSIVAGLYGFGKAPLLTFSAEEKKDVNIQTRFG